MMSSRVALWVTGACLLTFALTVPGQAEERSLRARLSGFEEVIAASPPTPERGAVLTTASGQFRGRIARDEKSIDYELSYEFPNNPGPTEGSTQYVNQAHLHFGQRHTTGGIIIFLCDSADTSGPPGTPDCPSPSGTVNGTLTAAGVIGPTGQGISAGDFAALIEALRAGTVYANVHTDTFPAGEIRGQVRPRDDD